MSSYYIMRCFLETRDRNGIIESVLTLIPGMQELPDAYNKVLEGQKKWRRS